MKLTFRVQHRFQNITCRVGQAAPATLLNKGELHCQIHLQWGQVVINVAS